MPIYIFSKSKFLFTNLISLNEKYLSSALTVSGNTLETCLGMHNNQSKKALGSYRAIEDSFSPAFPIRKPGDWK